MSSLFSFNRLLSFAVLVVALSACEGGHEDFLACKFDPLASVGSVCQQAVDSASSAQKSCVITQHPQCPDDVCMQWEGSGGFCTYGCGSDGDCPVASSCLLYSVHVDASGKKVEKRYCVTDAAQQ